MNVSVFVVIMIGAGIFVGILGAGFEADREHHKLSAQRQTECLAAGKSYVETAGMTACLDKDASFEVKRGGLF